MVSVFRGVEKLLEMNQRIFYSFAPSVLDISFFVDYGIPHVHEEIKETMHTVWFAVKMHLHQNLLHRPAMWWEAWRVEYVQLTSFAVDLEY